jgi:hypothetical protein
MSGFLDDRDLFIKDDTHYEDWLCPNCVAVINRDLRKEMGTTYWRTYSEKEVDEIWWREAWFYMQGSNRVSVSSRLTNKEWALMVDNRKEGTGTLDQEPRTKIPRVDDGDCSMLD